MHCDSWAAVNVQMCRVCRPVQAVQAVLCRLMLGHDSCYNQVQAAQLEEQEHRNISTDVTALCAALASEDHVPAPSHPQVLETMHDARIMHACTVPYAIRAKNATSWYPCSLNANVWVTNVRTQGTHYKA